MALLFLNNNNFKYNKAITDSKSTNVFLGCVNSIGLTNGTTVNGTLNTTNCNTGKKIFNLNFNLFELE